LGPIHLGIIKTSASGTHLFQEGAHETATVQSGPVKLSAREVGPAEVCTLKKGASKVDATKILPGELGSPQLGSTKISAGTHAQDVQSPLGPHATLGPIMQPECAQGLQKKQEPCRPRSRHFGHERYKGKTQGPEHPWGKDKGPADAGPRREKQKGLGAVRRHVSQMGVFRLNFGKFSPVKHRAKKPSLPKICAVQAGICEIRMNQIHASESAFCQVGPSEVHILTASPFQANPPHLGTYKAAAIDF
jgi:hypothetical protein